MKNNVSVIIFAAIITFSLVRNIFAEETVGCPHDVGKGKFKIRSKITHTAVAQCYSDEVWKALHGNSPYLLDYDKMVNLPDGWHQNITKIAVGFEYGIIDRLSVGVFFPFVVKDIKKQVWSNTVKKSVWKETKNNGFEDIWLSVKYLAYSKTSGLLGFDWEDGLFFALGYKPSISSDGKIGNCIGSGTHDLKFVMLSHPHLTEKLFLCSDVWYQYLGKVKDIEGFSKSKWDLGDKFGYRVFLAYEFYDHKFAVIGGPQGWVTGSNKDKDRKKLEDSGTYSNGIVMKFRWQPFGDEEAGSTDLGIMVPYANKTAFAPDFVLSFGGRIKF